MMGTVAAGRRSRRHASCGVPAGVRAARRPLRGGLGFVVRDAGTAVTRPRHAPRLRHARARVASPPAGRVGLRRGLALVRDAGTAVTAGVELSPGFVRLRYAKGSGSARPRGVGSGSGAALALVRDAGSAVVSHIELASGSFGSQAAAGSCGAFDAGSSIGRYSRLAARRPELVRQPAGGRVVQCASGRLARQVFRKACGAGLGFVRQPEDAGSCGAPGAGGSIGRYSGSRAAPSSGSFGSRNSAGLCRAPGTGGSVGRYSGGRAARRSGSFGSRDGAGSCRAQGACGSIGRVSWKTCGARRSGSFGSKAAAGSCGVFDAGSSIGRYSGRHAAQGARVRSAAGTVRAPGTGGSIGRYPGRRAAGRSGSFGSRRAAVSRAQRLGVKGGTVRECLRGLNGLERAQRAS